VGHEAGTRERRPDALTLEILRHLADGRTTADAARGCNVSEATVWRRLQALRDAWGVERNIQLVVHAVRRGLI
jgi:DNA-binding NarL/FixJ family response regulator